MQGSGDTDVRVIGNDWAVHCDFKLPSPFLELPPIVPSVHLEPPVDTCMVLQIGRGFRRSSTREVVWGCHGNHVQVWGEADGNHIFLKLPTHANTCVEAPTNDISQGIVDHYVQDNIWMRLMEARKPGRDYGSRGDPQRIDA